MTEISDAFWSLLSAGADRALASVPALGSALGEQTIEHLDEDWSIGCGYRVVLDATCSERAAWWVICRDCGWLTSECDQHRQDETERWRTTRGFLSCPGCHDFVPVENWRSLFLITPIEGRP